MVSKKPKKKPHPTFKSKFSIKKGLVSKKPQKNQTLGVVSLKPTKETTQKGSYLLNESEEKIRIKRKALKEMPFCRLFRKIYLGKYFLFHKSGNHRVWFL